MTSSFSYRTGNNESLASEFVQLANEGSLKFEVTKLKSPIWLIPEDILAVHYADAGAQGDAGAVELLYCSPNGVQVLYGNYAYGDLDLDAVIKLLPMLRCLDTRERFEPPYPFGGSLEVPSDWGYIYMGCMNHFFARRELCDNTSGFLDYLLNNGGRSWQIFEAIAWLCGAKMKSPSDDEQKKEHTSNRIFFSFLKKNQ